MTRKHFVAIAKAVRNLEHDGFTTDQITLIAHHLAFEFAAFNTGFDARKFINACNGHHVVQKA